MRVVTKIQLRRRLGAETKDLEKEKMFLVADETKHNNSFLIVHPSVFEPFKGTQLYDDINRVISEVNKKISQKYKNMANRREDRA